MSLLRSARFQLPGLPFGMLFVAVVLAGCDNPPEHAAPKVETDKTTAAASVDTRPPIDNPKRVLVTGQGAAELMIALGLEAKVVGMYYGKQFPAAADVATKLETIKAISETGPPSVEVALALKPDFVLAQFPTLDLDSSRGAAGKADFERHGAYVFSYTATSVAPKESTFEQFLNDVEALGRIFRVEERAQQLTLDARTRIRQVRHSVRGYQPRKGAIVFSASDQGLGVFGAGMLNDLLASAAVTNVYSDHPDSLLNISREDFARQPIEVYIIPDLHLPQRTPQDSFEWLQANFPQVPASRSGSYVAVGVELLNVGLRNVEAVEQIAREVHHAPPGQK